MLESYLRELVAGKLGLAPSALDIQAPLNRLGVDSLITLDLRMQVERELGLVVPVTRLLEGPSVATLAGWLRDHLPEAAARSSVTQPGAASRATAPEGNAPQEPGGIDLLTQVPELSDDAVDELLQQVLAERDERELAVKEGSND